MAKIVTPGADAVASKGWLKAHRYLVLRRVSQLGILALFLAGPWFGVWIVKGNLASSLTLETLPLSDPLLLLQVLLSGNIPAQSALIGAAIVLVFYLLVGGRVYCSWVCPVNLISDAAAWLRRRLNIKGASAFPRQTRYWLLLAVLLLPLVSGVLVWELINPVTLIYRALIFGLGLAWVVAVAILLLDLLVSGNAWCGHLCPVGAFYGLVGRFSLLRVAAHKRESCNDCMDCFVVCPESSIIKPALKGGDRGIGPIIESGLCTNCGRCVDVCAKDVFEFSIRFNNRLPDIRGSSNQREVVS